MENKKPSKHLSVINKELAINGDLVFKGSIQIHGSVIGNVSEVGNTNSLVTVYEGAEVRGKIDCSTVVVIGKVFGDIHAEILKIEKGSLIVGNCIYKSVQIHSGAKIKGGLFLKNQNFIDNFKFSSISGEDQYFKKNRKIQLNAELTNFSN